VARLKEMIPIEDYTISQTTLDDVFVSFASGNQTTTEMNRPSVSTEETVITEEKLVPNLENGYSPNETTAL
jgi:hypothetical protein